MTNFDFILSEHDKMLKVYNNRFLFYMVWIIVVTVSLFAFRAILLFYFSVRERSKTTNPNLANSKSFISVIVPARNEEDKIELCINSIMKSDYPINRFEVIAVNDRSDDSTAEILDRLSNQYTNLRVIHIKSDSEKGNLRGKPGALHIGIQSSIGDILMMTDADCTVNPKWISSISNSFEDPKIGLIPAYTLIHGDRAFDKIQAVEWIYMHTMASAGIGMNNPLGCYGNNLSIRRELYNQLGGYPNIKFSVTEDLALLQAVFKTEYKVNYICDYNCTVNTLPCVTLKEYILQHKRWAVGGIDLGYRAVFFVVTSLAVWIGLIVSIIAMKPIWILAILFTRFIGDYIIIKPAMNLLRQSHLHSWIIPTTAFIMLTELVVPPLILDRKIIWKGQTFKK